MDSISEEYDADQAATVSAQSEPVVSVRGLVKRYGSHEAVAGIDLDVHRPTLEEVYLSLTGPASTKDQR
jgi:ABC-type transporter Mla maintaining outer membrane lipid asymmetry ATPase subunit MlaF